MSPFASHLNSRLPRLCPASPAATPPGTLSVMSPNEPGNHLGQRKHAAHPPLPEQQAIATALSDVDALLAGLDQLITKKRDLKQAAMQQLLTGQTRLPGFHGEWEVKPLGDMFTFGGGYSASPRPAFLGRSLLPSLRRHPQVVEDLHRCACRLSGHSEA